MKIINISILCLWFALAGFLLYRNYTGVPLEKVQAVTKSIGKKTYWYDIYSGNKKTGFAKTTLEKIGDEIVIKHEREMKAIKTENGKQQEVTLEEKLNCICNPDYSIKSLEYTSNLKDEKGLRLTGKVENGDVIFFLESPEKRKTHKISINNRNFYLPITLTHALLLNKPAVNTVFQIPMLNFSKLTIDDVRVVLEEIRPLKVRADIFSVYKFKVGPFTIWGNDAGMIVKDEEPSGITLYSETEYIANDPSDRIIFDYTSLPFFKSNKEIPHSDGLKLSKIKIKGFKLDTRTYNNTAISVKDNELTIQKEDIEKMKANTYQLPYKNGFDVYLKPDDWVLSTDKTVAGNAHNMAVIEKNDAFRMARYLTSNLYFTVSPMPLFTISNSLDIFKTHLGDYLERTVMFASFGRAAGLPTRMVSGLAYRNGYFYFHAWPEVWLGRWIPVDPSLAQFPADVLHIPLRQGSVKDLISVLNDLKNIEIEVLEAS